MILTSTQNPVLKDVRRAALSGKPTSSGLLVAEGPNLLQEAIRSSWSIRQIFCTPFAAQEYSALICSCEAEVVEVSPGALGSASSAETTQGILSLLQPRIWQWPDLKGNPSLIVVLDRIQDPGNAGTIVRSAEAFGATGVVFLQGSTRVSNGKFLRATAGSIFRLPFLESVEVSKLLTLAENGRLKLFSLDMRQALTLNDAVLTDSCAIAVGSEGAGLQREILEVATPMSIPTLGVESLNAAVACSLALFEAFKQRTRR